MTSTNSFEVGQKVLERVSVLSDESHRMSWKGIGVLLSSFGLLIHLSML